MKRKAVFLDRDGIINKPIIKSGHKPYSPRKISELILNEDIKPVLEAAKQLGYVIIVITNQPDIERGLMTEKMLHQIHKAIRQKLPIDDILYCPHDDIDGCTCRKPKPGMLFEAAKKWDIDLSKSYYIGDQARDVQTALNAGCIPIILEYPYNTEVKDALRIRHLMELLQFIED